MPGRTKHVVVLLVAAVAAAAHAEPKHIFWFGNSLTGWNGVPDFGQTGVIDLVSFTAVQAGFEAPVNVHFVQDGARMLDHGRQASRLTTRLPAGETWDHIVLQGHSEETLAERGDLAMFLLAGGVLDDQARVTSPAVQTILYQTWAHAPGHSIYADEGGPVTSPQNYHEQVDAAYAQLAGQIVGEHGAGAAEVAPVGDAFALSGFDLSYYRGDLLHSNARGALLSAMVLYSTIYDDPTLTDISVDFGGSSLLAERLAALGLDEQDWLDAAALAEAVVIPSPAPLALAGVAAFAAARRRRGEVIQ